MVYQSFHFINYLHSLTCVNVLSYSSCEMGIAVMLDCEVLGLAVDMLCKHEENDGVVSAVCGLMEALFATGMRCGV